MSVIFFDNHELGNIAAAAALANHTFASDGYKKAIRHAARILSSYSVANAEAFLASYGQRSDCEDVKAHTEEDIIRGAPRTPISMKPKAARSNFSLLAYNAVDQSGRDRLPPEVAKGLLDVAGALLQGVR